MFKSKAGTRSLGVEYEDKVTAYFSLLLAQDSAVSHFYISSNDEEYGNFDDLVMQVDYGKNGAKEVVAVQLKHQQEGKKIPVNSFLADKGDFSLLKYFKETEKMNIPEEVSLVLFTNRKFEVDKEKGVLKLKIKATDGPENKTEPIHLEVFQPQEEDQPSLVKFINSNTSGEVFQFKASNINENFLKRFYFYSSDDDVKVIETKLKQQLYLGQTTCDQFMKFVENWSKEEGKKFKLNKETVISKFMECLLSPYLSTFCEEILGQDYLFDKLFSKFDVTIFEESVPIVQGYDRNSIKTRKIGITWKDERIFGLSKKTDAIKLLWHLNKIPLIIKSDCPNDILSKVLNLGKNESFGRRFIVIGKIDEEFKEKKVLRNLSDLLDEKLEEHLENCKVNFQGRELPLLDYVKDDKKIAKLFSTKDIASLLSGRETIFLGGNIDITFPYINRLLQNPIIDLDVLKNVSKDDVVVISCRGRKAFLENLGYTNTERIIIFEDFCSSQDFHQICSKHTSKNVHHLQVTKENYLSWMSTENASQNLMRFVSKTKQGAAVLDSEIFDNFTNRINVICAEPGMGKSVLMQFLTRDCPTHIWPILINLRESAKIFTKDADEILDEIIRRKYKENNLTKKIVDLMNSRKKIVLLFDGLDELPQENVQSVIKAVQHFSNNKYSLWVTSRNHLKNQLENELRVFALNLTQFDENNQRFYIKSRLDCDDKREDQIMTHLQNSLHQKILGTPLQLFMLTEIYKDASNSKDFISLTEMYSKFVDMKFETFEKKMCDLKENVLLQGQMKTYQRKLLREYQMAGVLTCFGNKFLEELRVYPEQVEDFLCNMRENGDIRGFIVGLAEDSIPVFVHQTYAEHFCAQYLKENVTVIRNFLSKILASSKEYETIRFMLDTMLANGSKPHLAVIYGNAEIIEESETVPKDLIGRTPADLACIYNDSGFYYELPQSGNPSKMYKIEFDFEIWNNSKREIALKRGIPTELYNTNPDFDIFRYCENIRSLYPLEILLKLKSCEIYHKKIKSLSIFREYVCTFILCCVRNNYTKLFSLLEVIPPMEIEIKYFDETYKENTFLHLIAHFGINEKRLRLTNLDGHSGNDCLMRTIAEIGININNKNQNGDTALLLACQDAENSKDVALSLIKSRADVNAQNKDGYTALLWASMEGHEDVVLRLIEAGADVNVQTKEGYTALLWASRWGHKDVVLRLIEAGADVNAQNKDGDTALLSASRYGHTDVVLLIEAGADVNVQTKEGYTALLWASRWGHKDVVLSLIEAGADVNVQTKEGYTALLWASRWGHKDVVLRLIEAGADVNAQNKDGDTALLWASRYGHTDVVLLIEAGADVNVQTKEGYTALLWASRWGDKDDVLRLIEAGADVNAQNKNGATALLWASGNGHKDVVLKLIEAGADVNAQDKDGYTALLWASRRGHKDIVLRLIEAGADINAQNKDGDTALLWASRWGYKDVVLRLIEAGADVNAQNEDGDTVLLWASAIGHKDIVLRLIEAGADVNVQNKNGDTALVEAQRRWYKDIVKILVENGARCHKNVKTPVPRSFFRFRNIKNIFRKK